jgi:hypothetical protein
MSRTTEDEHKADFLLAGDHVWAGLQVVRPMLKEMSTSFVMYFTRGVRRVVYTQIRV